MHNYVLFAIIVHFNIQELKNKQTFLQTEKAKFSHFDRTRRDKNQIFCTQDRPPTQKSSSNVMRIKYYTNEDRPNLGFKAKLSIATCGGTIHVDSRSLTRDHS